MNWVIDMFSFLQDVLCVLLFTALPFRKLTINWTYHLSWLSFAPLAVCPVTSSC